MFIFFNVCEIICVVKYDDRKKNMRNQATESYKMTNL